MSKALPEKAFGSWDEISLALKDISEIERKIEATQAEMNKKIDLLKEAAVITTAPLLEKKKILEAGIERFTKQHIAEFKESKTKNLTYGEVGFRKSSRIVVRNVKAIIEALKQNRMQDCITVTEQINKDELAKYDNASIEKVGAKRNAKDKFFYKILEERIEE